MTINSAQELGDGQTQADEEAILKGVAKLLDGVLIDQAVHLRGADTTIYIDGRKLVFRRGAQEYLIDLIDPKSLTKEKLFHLAHRAESDDEGDREVSGLNLSGFDDISTFLDQYGGGL